MLIMEKKTPFMRVVESVQTGEYRIFQDLSFAAYWNSPYKEVGVKGVGSGAFNQLFEPKFLLVGALVCYL